MLTEEVVDSEYAAVDGLAQRTVTNDFDTDFRVTSELISGSGSVAYAYDADSLPLRDEASGRAGEVDGARRRLREVRVS